MPASLLRWGIKTRKYAVLSVCMIGLTSCGNDPQKYIDRGNRFFDTRKYDDAVLQYRKALQKNPNSGDAHYRLALAESERGHLADAYRELQRAVELMPENVPAIFRLGQLALSGYNADPNRQPQFEQQAKTEAGLLLGRDFQGYEGNLLQGGIDLVDKKPAEAAAHFRQALTAKPDDPNATLGLARALVDGGQTEAGIDLARQLVAKDKTFDPAYDYLFRQYAQADRKSVV